MTPPPYYGQQPPAAAGTTSDARGVLGIVFAFCWHRSASCSAILSLLEAKKVGKQPTLAYVAFGLTALVHRLNIIGFAGAVLGFLG